MNSFLPIVLRGTQAAQNNAIHGELDFTIAALEETIHELRKIQLEANADDAGVVRPGQLQAA